MKVFVTGASGWIGSAVVPELVAAGHEVTGLARSDSSAAALTAAGARVQQGSLDDLDSLQAGAAASDGVIHLAFKHEEAFSGDFAGASDADRRAIEVLGEALGTTGKPLVIASGVAGLTPGRVATEEDLADPQVAGPRAAGSQAALALADHGIRSSVLRLAPTVHGDGDNGFMAALIGAARAKGVSGYLGDGSNRWAAVNRADAARLFRLAVEQAPAGSVLHGVAEEGVTLRSIAEVIGDKLDLPVVPVSADDAPGHFGFLAMFLGSDLRASSRRTQQLMDWHPTHPGLVDDLEAGFYFGQPA